MELEELMKYLDKVDSSEHARSMAVELESLQMENNLLHMILDMMADTIELFKLRELDAGVAGIVEGKEKKGGVNEKPTTPPPPPPKGQGNPVSLWKIGKKKG